MPTEELETVVSAAAPDSEQLIFEKHTQVTVGQELAMHQLGAELEDSIESKHQMQGGQQEGRRVWIPGKQKSTWCT